MVEDCIGNEAGKNRERDSQTHHRTEFTSHLLGSWSLSHLLLLSGRSLHPLSLTKITNRQGPFSYRTHSKIEHAKAVLMWVAAVIRCGESDQDKWQTKWKLTTYEIYNFHMVRTQRV